MRLIKLVSSLLSVWAIFFTVNASANTISISFTATVEDIERYGILSLLESIEEGDTAQGTIQFSAEANPQYQMIGYTDYSPALSSVNISLMIGTEEFSFSQDLSTLDVAIHDNLRGADIFEFYAGELAWVGSPYEDYDAELDLGLVDDNQAVFNSTSLMSIVGFVLDDFTGTSVRLRLQASTEESFGDVGASLAFNSASAVGPGIGSSAPVPEPTTIILFSAGIVGLAGMSRSKKKYDVVK